MLLGLAARLAFNQQGRKDHNNEASGFVMPNTTYIVGSDRGIVRWARPNTLLTLCSSLFPEPSLSTP